MITVYFNRTFLTGDLKGLTYKDSLRFPDKYSVNLWVYAIKKSLDCTIEVTAIRPDHY